MNKNDKKMVIKIYDTEHQDAEYIKLDKYDEHIQEKADFFFFEDNFVNEEYEKLPVEEIACRYNKMFSENITPEQAKEALEATDFGGYGPAADRYIDIFKALGFKVENIVPPIDLHIITGPKRKKRKIMDTVSRVVLSVVKPGDTVEIIPIDKFPNAERVFKVDEVTKNGFIYGITETCDGYEIPFYWIKSLKIVKDKQ